MLRKIHPTQINKEGRPSKTSFAPKPIDQGKISVDRESIITAEECHAQYAEKKKFSPLLGGVWAVTTAECKEINLDCFSDPIPADDADGPNPAHALIDMSKLNERETLNAATTLYSLAKSRGKIAPKTNIEPCENNEASSENQRRAS